jgi:signal recognition particle receptor subunit beta
LIIDQLAHSIQLKICYYGSAFSGKTTSLKTLFNHFGKKERVLSIDSSIKRTLFFDYGIISFENKNFLLKIHLYSTTGQDFYVITRPIILQAIDGIIFIVDSQREAYYRNLASWDELCNYFAERIIDLPKVIAFNKQDMRNKFSPNEFLDNIDYLTYNNIIYRKTIAPNGEGILACFEDILNIIFKNLCSTQAKSK